MPSGYSKVAGVFATVIAGLIAISLIGNGQRRPLQKVTLGRHSPAYDWLGVGSVITTPLAVRHDK